MQLSTFFTSFLAMAVTVVFANTPSITAFHDGQCNDSPGTTVPCIDVNDYDSSQGPPCVAFDGSMGSPAILYDDSISLTPTYYSASFFADSSCQKGIGGQELNEPPQGPCVSITEVQQTSGFQVGSIQCVYSSSAFL